MQEHLARDPRAFWGYIRSRKGNSNHRRIIQDGRLLSEYECAREFARFFQSVYSPEPPVLSAKAAGASSVAAAPQAWARLACLRPADV